jgi:phage host-nuclease inhibitor protein Gam
MDNLAMSFIEQEAGEDKPFIIDDDNKAEWALKKIAEDKAETQRLINVCQTFINEYQLKIEKLNEQLESKTSYFKGQLFNYFNTVEHKKTKTQEAYKLPSGTLKLRMQGPDFIRDDEKIILCLKDADAKEFIKTKETLDWAALKKTVIVDGDKVVDIENGIIIDGVKVQERPPKFEVEV